MTHIYLLHFDPPYRHAGHYLGVTNRDDVTARVAEHVAGHGANLCRVARRAGSRILLARTWRDVPRRHENRLKGRSLRPLCPLCAADPANVGQPFTRLTLGLAYRDMLLAEHGTIENAAAALNMDPREIRRAWAADSSTSRRRADTIVRYLDRAGFQVRFTIHKKV